MKINIVVDRNSEYYKWIIVFSGRCLPVLCVHLFHMYGLISHFKLDATKAWKLFSLIEEGYHSTNPYHNSIHAADVTQAMHCFLQQKRVSRYDTIFLLIAAFRNITFSLAQSLSGKIVFRSLVLKYKIFRLKTS